MAQTLHRGVFTLSFDFELVWGMRDLMADISPLKRLARVTRDHVFDGLVGMLESRGAVATWATVGNLFRDGGGPANHPEVVPPRHAWGPSLAGSWFDGVPSGSEQEHPEFYARSLVTRLRDAGQEIGSHSFSHPIFGDPGCSREAADTDLARCVAEAAHIGVKMRSFVFPRNVPGHVDLLVKHGFTCWRGLEPVWWRNERVPGSLKRLAHLADVIRAAPAPTVMPFRDEHGLICIPSSCSLLPIDGVRRLIPMSRRVDRCLRGIDLAARERRISHLYLHPINLASEPVAMLAALEQIVDYAARLRDAGRIEILPMAEIAERFGDSLTTRGAKERSAPS